MRPVLPPDMASCAGSRGHVQQGDKAIRAAITIASATRPSIPTAVVVEATGGERYPIWSYGRDSYVSAT